MILEGMVEQPSAWQEGRGFSDKPFVLRQLRQIYFVTSQSCVTAAQHVTPVRKVLDSLARSIASICAADFPSNEDCVELVALSVHHSSLVETNPADILLATLCAAAAKKNTELWLELTRHVVSNGPDLLGMLADASDDGVQALHRISFDLSLLLSLIDSRPGVAEQRQSSPSHWKQLQDVTVWFGNTASATAAIMHCINNDVAYAVVSRLLKLLQSSLRFPSPALGPVGSCWGQLLDTLLAALLALGSPCTGDAASTPMITSSCKTGPSTRMTSLAEKILECVQNILSSDDSVDLHSMFFAAEQTAAESGWTLRASGSSFSSIVDVLLPYFSMMPSDEDEEDHRANSVSSEFILQMISDDDAVLTGCGSGSPSAIAGAIVQLLIERELAIAVPFMRRWNALASSWIREERHEQRRAVHARQGLLNLIMSISKQCEVSGICLVDHCGKDEIRTAASFICQWIGDAAEEELTRCLGFFALCAVMKLSRDLPEIGNYLGRCNVFLEFAATAEGGAVTADAPYSASLALYCFGKLLTVSTEVCDAFADSSLVISPRCAVWLHWVATKGGPVGAFLAAMTARTLLEVSSAVFVDQFWSMGQLAAADVVHAVMQHLGNGVFATVVTPLLKALFDSHRSGKDCAAMAAVHSVVGSALTYEPLAQQAFRSAVEYTVFVLTQPKRDSGCQAACIPVGFARSACDACSALASGSEVADDNMLRLMASCVAAASAWNMAEASDTIFFDAASSLVLFSGRRGLLLRGVSAGNITTSFSACCASLGITSILLAAPSAQHFGKYVTVFNDFFWAPQRGGMMPDYGVTGCFLFPAAVLTMGGSEYVAALCTGNTNRSLELVAKFFGVWASLLSHCDMRTEVYTVCGWAKLLGQLALSREDWNTVMVTPQRQCNLLVLPSAHSKNPIRRADDCSLLDAITFGLLAVSSFNMSKRPAAKLSSFSNHELYDCVAARRNAFVQCDQLSMRIVSEWGVAEGASHLLQLIANTDAASFGLSMQKAQDLLLS